MMSSSNNSIANTLQGLQQVCITVDDFEKSIEFYTQVLGGTEVSMQTGRPRGLLAGREALQNMMFQAEELDAAEVGLNDAKSRKKRGIPNLRDREETVESALILFDNIAVQLMHFKETTNGTTFRMRHPDSSPAFINSMCLSFRLRDEVDMGAFVKDLEDECDRRGFVEVRANRAVRVPSEEQRRAMPDALKNNSYKISGTPEEVGDWDGWSFVYVKGPNGEQLEFVQCNGRAKEALERARKQRLAEEATTLKTA